MSLSTYRINSSSSTLRKRSPNLSSLTEFLDKSPRVPKKYFTLKTIMITVNDNQTFFHSFFRFSQMIFNELSLNSNLIVMLMICFTLQYAKEWIWFVFPVPIGDRKDLKTFFCTLKGKYEQPYFYENPKPLNRSFLFWQTVE